MIELAPIERPQRSIFINAYRSEQSELATEDPLALDYLGQQVGLLMLPTLTTRSRRAQGFAMVLYGLHLAGVAIQRYGLPDTDEQRRVLFEQWERFWALATFEYRRGELGRSDWDNMRGFRGAKAAWKSGDSPLPLDYTLISRQQELGHLGAYLAPLRRSKLVPDGGLSPATAAKEIIGAFWNEPELYSHAARYEEYALVALEPGRTRIARKHGNLTLATVGERSRLTSLANEERRLQRERLHRALLVAPGGHTPRVASIVETATHQGILDTRAVLDAAIAGTVPGADSSLADLLITARAFGDLSSALLLAFDRAYATLDASGWTAEPHKLAAETWRDGLLDALKDAVRELLSAPRLVDVRRFPMHVRAFLAFISELQTMSASAALDRLLAYHDAVQRERRRGQGWIQRNGEGFVLSVTSYRARPDGARYPAFKLDAVRTLLVDVGRLTQAQLARSEEAP